MNLITHITMYLNNSDDSKTFIENINIIVLYILIQLMNLMLIRYKFITIVRARNKSM